MAVVVLGANGQLVTRSSARDIGVTLKGSSRAPDLENGQMVMPASGTYTFTLFPCAIWGAPSQVQICTSPE